MKQLITIALLLCSTWVFGQTVTTPPSGSKGYGTPVATPSGEILVGRNGSYTYVTRKAYTDSLIALGWNKQQVDSAIAANLANYLKYGDNVSGLTNDAGYLTLGEVPTPPVTSVAGKMGAVVLNKIDVDLGFVDNTADIDKPVSAAQQTALNLKLDGSGPYLSNLNDAPVRGFFYTDNATSNQPFSAFATGFAFSRTGTQRANIWYDVTSTGRLFIGRSVNSGASWTRNEIWHSGNFTPPTVFTTSSNGLVPSAPSSGNLFLKRDGTWQDPQAGGGGGSNTDLSVINRTSTTLQINSSTGTAATIPAATTSLSGLMTSADKAALNSFNPASYVPTSTSINTGVHLAGGGALAGDLTLSFRPDFGAWIVDKSSNERLFFGGGGTDFVLKLAGNNRFSFRNNSSTEVFSIDYLGNISTGSVPWPRLTGVPSTFAPSPHTHNANDINAGTLAIARIPTGTTGSTVALGNHTHAFSALTSKPTTLSGYGITDAVPSSRTINSKALSANVTLTASDVGAVPLSGNATVSGSKTFSSPVVVANATASNHAVTLGQMNAAVREIIKVDSGLVITLPGPTFSAGGTWQQTVIVPGASIGDVVAVSKSGSGWSAGSGLIATGYVYANNSVAVDIVNAGSVSFSVVPLTVQIVVIK